MSNHTGVCLPIVGDVARNKSRWPRVRGFDPDVVKTGLILYHVMTPFELTTNTTTNGHKATADFTGLFAISISFSAFKTADS